MDTLASQSLTPTQLLGATPSSPTSSSQDVVAEPVACWGHVYYMFKGLTRRYDLSDDYYVIGRGNEANIQIDSPECSKRHCGICYLRPDTPEKGQGVVIVVDNSTNGTILNDRALQRGLKSRLKHGDVIDIRTGHRFIFHEPAALAEEGDEVQDPEFATIVGKDYLFVKRLGVGTYAVANKVICRTTSVCYACKAVCKRRAGFNERMLLTPRTLDSVPEIAAMKNLQHPNIVQIHDVRQTARKLYIFMQLAEGGDLFNYLVQESAIDETEVKFIIFQTLQALKYLHERNITHRDIKPENILLLKHQKFSRVFIGDFGLAKIIHSETRMRTMCGTLNYLAPEMMGGRHAKNQPSYSSGIDCWAIGVMTFYLLCGYLPFDHNSEDELRKIIVEGQYSFKSEFFDWDCVSPDCQNLISKFLCCDPKKRLTVVQALQHPWFVDSTAEIATMYARVTESVEATKFISPRQ